MSTYEMHIGSWKRGGNGDEILSYANLAVELPKYLNDMGFTHVEFMPVAEHPFGGSWGYQVSSDYVPKRGVRHRPQLQVHGRLFAQGEYRRDHRLGARALSEGRMGARDSTAQLCSNTRIRFAVEHPDWGTLVFNFSRHEVRNFLLANALYWLEEFHIDGLRVDAVASMLYLDYSREPGEWLPNEFGGRENLEAVSFLKEMNETVYRIHPGTVTIAEESTAWPGVSRPTYLGGLGFGFKWNMGWMHDTLDYYSKEPIYRRFHHNSLTFGLIYAWHENLYCRFHTMKLCTARARCLRRCRATNGNSTPTCFVVRVDVGAPRQEAVVHGRRDCTSREWSHDRSLDWHLLDFAEHKGTQVLIKSMNEVYNRTPALFDCDFSDRGFRWIDASDVEQNVLSFLRQSEDGSKKLVCIANLSPVPRYGYRIGLPHAGSWREVLIPTPASSPEAGSGTSAASTATKSRGTASGRG